MIQKCLVTGASGFIGLPLCRALKEQGAKVRALHRNPQEGPWDEEVLCDFFSLKHFQASCFSEEVLEGIDTIFHLAGIAHSEGFSFDSYWAVNIESTKLLLDTAIKRGVKRFIYFSSIKAAGNPQDEYGRSKKAAEELVLDYGRKHSIEVSILRPSLVYGANPKGNLLSLIQAIDKGYFPPIPEIGNVRSMIAVADVVAVALKVANSFPEVKDQIFTLADGEAYSTRKLYDAIRSALGLKPITFSIPAWFLRFGLSTILRKPRVYEKLMGSSDFTEDARKTHQVLNFQPQFTFYNVVPEMIQHYRVKR